MTSARALIIGGGLGGLCLAQGLKRAGLPFALFERAQGELHAGQGDRLRIDAAGQEALACCLPVDLLYLLYQSASYADADPWYIDGRMTPFETNRLESDAFSSGALPDLIVHQQTLREILACGLHNSMHLGRRLEAFEESADGVTARFDGGETVCGTILCGADGAASVVREQVMTEIVSETTGQLCLYGRLPATAENCRALGRDLCAGTSVIRADGVTCTVDVMTFRGSMQVLAGQIAPDCTLSAVEDYIYWELTGPAERLSAIAGSADRHDAMGRLVRGWARPLQTLFLRGNPAEWGSAPLHRLRQDRPLRTQHVALLGDAAHGLNVTAGAAAAFQDAADLVARLRRVWPCGAIGGALRAYEEARRIRANYASLAADPLLSNSKAA